MNSNHIINGWVAQLRVDARRGVDRSRGAAWPASPTVDDVVAAEPASPALDHPAAVAPARTRGRLLPVPVWGRGGASRRAVGGPCLSLA
jgi:hypothetical protein